MSKVRKTTGPSKPPESERRPRDDAGVGRLRETVDALFARYHADASPERRESARAMVDLLQTWIVLGGVPERTTPEADAERWGALSKALAAMRGADTQDQRIAYAVGVMRWGIDQWRSAASEEWRAALPGTLRDGLAVAAPEFASLSTDDAREALASAAPANDGKNMRGAPIGGRGKLGPAAIVARLAVACDAWGARGAGVQVFRRRVQAAAGRQR